MKLIKMLRTLEATSGRLDGDVQYKLPDAEAAALIADGSAILLQEFPEPKAKKEEAKEKNKSKRGDSKSTSKAKKK